MDRIHEDHNPTVTVIQPQHGWIPVNLKEIWHYRELFYFLTKRDIKVRYKQTVLGGLWAVIQPVFTMIVFSLFFGKLAKVPSDGIPYPLFVYAGLLPWLYFANALTASGNSMVTSSNLIKKVYFPRIIVPVSAALTYLVDFFIALSVLFIMMIYYQFSPGWNILLLPFFIGIVLICATGFGLWLSALNVKYRDIRYIIPFLIQLWLFVTPVIYPVSMIPENYQWLLALNPMTGVIEAMRALMLNQSNIDWTMQTISAGVSCFVFLGGLHYFKRMERSFADLA